MSRIGFRSRSRPRADCSSRRCARVAGRCIRSTRWRWLATGNGTPSRGRSPITPTPWRWRTSCAPTLICTGRCADSELARAIAVLARAHQDATWRRARASNELRSLLREYHPGFLTTFASDNATNLASADARAVLAIASTPALAAKLSKARIAAALRRGGRQRGADRVAAQLHDALRRPQSRHDRLVEQAMAAQALRLLATLNVECASVDQLGQAVADAFVQHPTTRSSPTFPDSVISPEPECSVRSATTARGSSMHGP